MKTLTKQAGMSGWVLLFILIVMSFLVLLGLKLFPIYLESFKIDQAIKGVVEQPGIGDQTVQEIRHMLIKRMDIDDVRSVTGRNWAQHGSVTKKGKKVTISINYTNDTHLFGNLWILAEFEKSRTN